MLGLGGINVHVLASDHLEDLSISDILREFWHCTAIGSKFLVRVTGSGNNIGSVLLELDGNGSDSEKCSSGEFHRFCGRLFVF